MFYSDIYEYYESYNVMSLEVDEDNVYPPAGDSHYHERTIP